MTPSQKNPIALGTPTLEGPLILKHVFGNFLKNFYNVIVMKKVLFISAPYPEVPYTK
jgi:hypothetical protein